MKLLKLPRWMITVLDEFAPAIYGISTWYKIEGLVAGAILCRGKRTVSAIWRVMGLSQARNYARDHPGLSRAVWAGLEVSAILLKLWLKTFEGGGPLVFGIEETLERRRGAKTAAKGIDRDGVRSSQRHFVKASGLRWVSLMWLTRVGFAKRSWALPCLTALAPAERDYEQRGRPPKKITDWARQLVDQLRRWLPTQPWVVVADSSYAPWTACALVRAFACR